MKVERVESFAPLKITLETQKEIDCLYAVFVYSPITEALEKTDNPLHRFWEKLTPFKTDAYERDYFSHLDHWVKRACSTPSPY